MSPLRHALERLAAGRDLSTTETAAAFDAVMAGEAAPAEIAALLMGLRAKGETADELAGAAQALRAAMIRLPYSAPSPRHPALVDTCGTGGGARTTFNISTTAAFAVAGAGVPVAKHGNRSFTSRSGSADVLEALGVDITLPPERAARLLEAVGLVFLFAPTYHPAMRHAAPVRRELGVATVMNLLGPLGNPAGVRRQVIGVADPARGPLMARALARLGVEHAMVVHADAGMDEIAPSGPTRVWEVVGGPGAPRISEWTLDPGAYGMAHDDLDALAGGEPEHNADRLERLLTEPDADPAGRAAVVLNAAAAIYVSGVVESFGDAVQYARLALEDGRAMAVLERLRQEAGK